MSLLQRVEKAQQQATDTTKASPPVPVAQPVAQKLASSPAREGLLREIRLRLQEEVISAFNSLVDVSPTEVRPKLEAIVDRIVSSHGFAVTRDERLRLIEHMVDDLTGLGPLEPLLHDETITEVMVN